jgi:large subunit ribosomal protein L15
MRLNDISDNPGAVKKRIRVGRGPGSGKGKTAGRGIKGQKSRSGVAIKAFEGGQMPLYQRLPKRGFNSRSSKKLLDQVNLGSIQKLIDAKKIAENNLIDIAVLRSVGLINKNAVSVKLLAKGSLASKVKIEVSSASEKARQAVEKMGGELNLLSP